MSINFTPGKNNAKLRKLELATGKKVFAFSLLSGYSCPYAKECLSKAVDVDGRRHIEDGQHMRFRCFSASEEALFPAVYNHRKNNLDLAKSITCDDIEAALPAKAEIVRIHVAGDFLSSNYMLEWIKTARNNRDVIFYAYTKSLPFWLKHRKLIDDTPNFVLTASYGGWRDELITKHKLRSAVVVNYPQDTMLEIDDNDTHAALPEYRHQDFALLLHGVQRKGTVEAKAVEGRKHERHK